MLRQILMVSTALCAVTVIAASAPQASAAMRIHLPKTELSSIQLVAYDPLVYRAQVGLSRNGFDTGTPDGKMGPRTRGAIEAYQRANGMSVTGWASDSLVAQLEGGQPTRVDRPGDRRRARIAQTELINQTQVELRRHGYTIAYVGGGLTGETTDAIQNYQQSRGLERTGTPSESLLATMRSDNRVSGQAPTPTYGSVPVVTAQPVLCADLLHQGRPGGTDYQGPAVAGCP